MPKLKVLLSNADLDVSLLKMKNSVSRPLLFVLRTWLVLEFRTKIALQLLVISLAQAFGQKVNLWDAESTADELILSQT
jgi:hypothetical protein